MRPYPHRHPSVRKGGVRCQGVVVADGRAGPGPGRGKGQVGGGWSLGGEAGGRVGEEPRVRVGRGTERGRWRVESVGWGPYLIWGVR